MNNQPQRFSEDTESLELRAALNALVVDSVDLRQLEKLLGGFNLFRVLRFEHGEIRHSNVLAWLLQTDETHGLKDLFFRRFLMRVFHESAAEDASYLSPAEIDSLEIKSVWVTREWNHIDLLLEVQTFNDEMIIVAIENKINATQSEDQLEKYRQKVEAIHGAAKHRLFIFLSQREQEPADDLWTSASYAQVHDVLRECFEEQRSVIGAEPAVLIENYLRLLKESFMENTALTELASKIYRKHSVALDFIIDHRPDSIQKLTEAIAAKVKSSANHLGIIPMATSKGYVRFLPQEWDSKANRKGVAWGSRNSAFVLCELSLWGKKPDFRMIEGQAPKEWRDKLWQLSHSAPFKSQKRKRQPAKYTSFNAVKGNFTLIEVDAESVDELADEIWNWCASELQSPEFKQAAKVVTEHLKSLPE